MHTIVDGDSLEGLAEQYLGTDQRWTEIYEANRQLLRSPDVLPIGVRLRIPLSREADQDLPGLSANRPLAPVTPGGSPSTERGGEGF
jgi:hypothetical protein